MNRFDYDKLHRLVLGKNAYSGDGWGRWQAVWKSGADALFLHPCGAVPPKPRDDDYLLTARCGELIYKARIAASDFPVLTTIWDNALTGFPDLYKALGTNPRARARAFLHNSLIDGFVIDPGVGTLMSAAIV
jgi:hypothetical protein